MTKLHVLFADDQIPWNDPERDEAVFTAINEEIGEELRNKGEDPRTEYEKNKQWFHELIQYLETKYSLEIFKIREYREAEQRLGNLDRHNYDVAIVDLSWYGDDNCPHNPRKDVGLELINAVNSSKRHIPVIAFSQSFAEDKELMLQVTNRNAFPMQKNYNRVDFQSLASAIIYLTRNTVDQENNDPPPLSPNRKTVWKDTVDQENNDPPPLSPNGKTVWDVVSALPTFLIPVTIFGLFTILLLFAQMNTEPGKPVKVLGLELYDKAP